ncbi:hypothetical protein MBEHAL_0059 [Halarchaeum acidiphilum MH1-52-1]|uniref:Uncharacterized protein n=1 Tax=Halarchaeum acidiphilum MH1-52-1 TaxID=1261545 RepID=U3A0Y0_9EURY|nr:hypothetical protein [Halarchaeum acidiphilum]GAD51299.1 hypothetical protein MBEHAL_0059 [Halarchaeum acidiphilum MH1-52-1]
MAEVSITHVILFIAAISLSTIVGGTATNIAGDVGHAIEHVGSDYAEQVSHSVTVISDPGATLYDANTDTLTLLAKNTGESRLPTDRGSLLVLVDGEPVNVTNVSVADGSYWRPGHVARIRANTSLDGGAHRVVVSVDESRDYFSFPYRGGSSEPLRDGVVVYTTGSSLNTIPYDRGNVTTQLDSSPPVIGPASVDFDGDGAYDSPYIENGTIHLVYGGGGRTKTLGGNPPAPSNTKTRIGVGTWNGSDTSVFYSNATNKDIYRVSPETGPTHVLSVASKAVVGVADFDGDSADELIYLGTSADVKYADPDGTTHDTGISPGSNVRSVGTPADFDGDGVARVPYVTGSNNVKLVDDDGEMTKFTSPSAVKTGVSVDDVDRDGDPEIVYVGSNKKYLRYLNLDGTTGYVHDSAGDKIPVDTTAGTA